MLIPDPALYDPFLDLKHQTSGLYRRFVSECRTRSCNICLSRSPGMSQIDLNGPLACHVVHIDWSRLWTHVAAFHKMRMGKHTNICG